MAKKDEDYTKQPQATNQSDVDAQDTKTRLYQSLAYSYGQQQEQSDESYDKAISQQDRAMLSRGMQRSSYGAQTLANLQSQKVKERNRIGEAMIADYQSRLSQLEEAEAARKFQTSEREATQAYNTSERIAQQAYSTSEREAQQAYSTSEREAQQAFSAQQAQLERDQAQSQFAEQMALQREQLEYSKMSDEQKLLFNYIETALVNGSDVSDELLAKVGMTRADFNLMKKSSGSYAPKKKSEEEEPTVTPDALSKWWNDFMSGNSGSGIGSASASGISLGASAAISVANANKNTTPSMYQRTNTTELIE